MSYVIGDNPDERAKAVARDGRGLYVRVGSEAPELLEAERSGRPGGVVDAFLRATNQVPALWPLEPDEVVEREEVLRGTVPAFFPPRPVTSRWAEHVGLLRYAYTEIDFYYNREIMVRGDLEAGNSGIRPLLDELHAMCGSIWQESVSRQAEIAEQLGWCGVGNGEGWSWLVVFPAADVGLSARLQHELRAGGVDYRILTMRVGKLMLLRHEDAD